MCACIRAIVNDSSQNTCTCIVDVISRAQKQRFTKVHVTSTHTGALSLEWRRSKISIGRMQLTAVSRLFVLSVHAVRHTIAYQVRGNHEPVGATEHLRLWVSSRERRGGDKHNAGRKPWCSEATIASTSQREKMAIERNRALTQPCVY